MIALITSDDALLLRFASDITFVDYAVDIIDDVLAYRGLAERTGVLLVSRELLKNAVVHGNRNDTGKAVTLRLERLSEERYRVEAQDDGSGFDVASLTRGGALAFPTGSEGPAGRATGFALVGALADHVDFNETGNRITAYVDAVASSSDNARSCGRE
ncbi:MAG: ATP-binding protein [Spirochaetales bacterium]|nr:ATP-binding protein [Spirochaetales bacterium]